MVRVKIRAFALIREKLGWKERELEVKARTLEDLLKAVKTVNGKNLYELITDEGEIKSNFLVLLNGKEVGYLKGLKTRIKEGDAIFIFPPVSGG